jgi:hypothetical protein
MECFPEEGGREIWNISGMIYCKEEILSFIRSKIRKYWMAAPVMLKVKLIKY